MNPALHSWREELPSTIVQLLAYLGEIAVLSMAAAQFFQAAPAVDKVEANWQACHTFAYIAMKSPILNAAGWNAEVTKMIKAFGSPIDDADAKAIAEYLAKNYGP
ncbi:MAG TPA: hypothetical protein VGF53_14945 [Pseudolabrys sp.]|jgi:NADH:ubiquinone oxidoreductase subunit 6 (subunit J)